MIIFTDAKFKISLNISITSIMIIYWIACTFNFLLLSYTFSLTTSKCCGENTSLRLFFRQLRIIIPYRRYIHSMLMIKHFWITLTMIKFNIRHFLYFKHIRLILARSRLILILLISKQFRFGLIRKSCTNFTSNCANILIHNCIFWTWWNGFLSNFIEITWSKWWFLPNWQNNRTLPTLKLAAYMRATSSKDMLISLITVTTSMICCMIYFISFVFCCGCRYLA